MGAKKISLLVIVATLLLFHNPVWSNEKNGDGTSGGKLGITDLFNVSAILSCVKLEIIGVCLKTVYPPTWGILIRFWRPELLVETVKKPGDTTIPAIGSVTSAIAKEALKALTEQIVTSGSQGSSGNENLQFNEVHVYNYPYKKALSKLYGGTWCIGGSGNSDSSDFYKYLSEVDYLEWRKGNLESIVRAPQILLGPLCISPINPSFICMGTWGPIYPRTGFLAHQSEVVGSTADVFRAVSNTWSGSFNHIKLSPINWEANTADRIQFIYPRWSGCIKIGTIPATWETGKRSTNGKYLYLYWKQIICCK